MLKMILCDLKAFMAFFSVLHAYYGTNLIMLQWKEEDSIIRLIELPIIFISSVSSPGHCPSLKPAF